ncbi:MAG: enhanced serine sensitivity protein SseB C-terminal domain-containing protein [Armatimonadota bacterium]
MRIVTDPPDSSQDHDNTPFLQAMEACGDDFTPGQREDVYRTLLATTLLIPVGLPAGMGDMQPAQEGAPPAPLTKVNPETGEHLLLVFTDQETMLRYHMAGFSYILVPAAKLFERLNVEGAPALIVCAGGSHLPVSREEVRELANGRIPPPQLTTIPNPIAGGARLSFRELDAELPHGVREDLRRLLEPETDVKEVYAFLLRQDDERPEFAVAMVFYTFDPEAARPLMDKIAVLLKPYSPWGEPLAVIPLEDGSEPATDLREMIPAIFQRQLI